MCFSYALFLASLDPYHYPISHELTDETAEPCTANTTMLAKKRNTLNLPIVSLELEVILARLGGQGLKDDYQVFFWKLRSAKKGFTAFGDGRSATQDQL